jgi:hypothetical protein
LPTGINAETLPVGRFLNFPPAGGNAETLPVGRFLSFSTMVEKAEPLPRHLTDRRARHAGD